jgi:hypothetical protein
MCRQFDLMVSFQLGLPAQIPPNSWDTENPRNLLDTDFDEDTKILPPSRPEKDATQLLYFIVKSRLMTTFGKVCARALSFQCDDTVPEEVTKLDREVRETHGTVPEVLHVKPMSQSYADPSYLTMVRTNCEFLYQKTIIVLHRKYMNQGNYPGSTKACTDAAVAIIRHMLDLHREFQPGGQLHEDRWMLSSFTMNDFYLAAMVLCLNISTWKRKNPTRNIADHEIVARQYQMLKESYELCQEMSPTSNEARRVAAVLGAMSGDGGRTLSEMSSIPSNLSSGATSLADTQNYTSSMIFPMQRNLMIPPLRSASGQPMRPALSATSGSYLSQAQSTSAPSMAASTGTISNQHLQQSKSTNSFQNLVSGINNPAPLEYNPQMFFLPFSASHTPTSTSTDHVMEGASGDPMQMPGNLDVDWAFLDQWMALPQVDMLSASNDQQLGLDDQAQQSQQQDQQMTDSSDWSSEPMPYTSGPALFMTPPSRGT